MASGAKRLALTEVLQVLGDEARARRAALPYDSDDRQFYLGVEAAARAVLHPEAHAARAGDWLDHEASAFRNGFLATSAQIAGAVSSGEIPSRLLLPTPA